MPATPEAGLTNGRASQSRGQRCLGPLGPSRPAPARRALGPAAAPQRRPLSPGGQLMLEPFEIFSLSDLARDQLWGTATGGLAGDSLLWIKSYRP